MGFDILELPQIPRERDKLKAIIGEARYARRRSRIIRSASYAIIALALLLLWASACSHSPQPEAGQYLLHLPLLMR